MSERMWGFESPFAHKKTRAARSGFFVFVRDDLEAKKPSSGGFDPNLVKDVKRHLFAPEGARVHPDKTVSAFARRAVNPRFFESV